jgi:hypothetical protein
MYLAMSPVTTTGGGELVEYLTRLVDQLLPELLTDHPAI